MVASQQNRPRSYDEWVNRFQELDSSVQATREAHSQVKYRSTENPILRSIQTRDLNNILNPWMGDEQEDTRGVQQNNLVDLTEGEIGNYNQRNWDIGDFDEEIPCGGEWITPEHNAKCIKEEQGDVMEDEQDNLVDQIEGRMMKHDEEISELGEYDEEIPLDEELIAPEDEAACTRLDLTRKNNCEWEKRLSREQYEF